MIKTKKTNFVRLLRNLKLKEILLLEYHFHSKSVFYYSLGLNYYFRAVKITKCVRRFVPAFIDNMAAHDKGVDSTSTSCLGQVRSPRDYQTTITNTDYVTLAHFITLL